MTPLLQYSTFKDNVHSFCSSKTLHSRIGSVCYARTNFVQLSSNINLSRVRMDQLQELFSSFRKYEMPSVSMSIDSGKILQYRSVDFRSNLLNAIGRKSFPDPKVWKNFKVPLCNLLLEYTRKGDNAFQGTLKDLISLILHKTSTNFERVPVQYQELVAGKLQAKQESLSQDIQLWIFETVKDESFSAVIPILEKVLASEPLPIISTLRDGKKAEEHVGELLNAKLPDGWKLHSSAVVESISGIKFKSERSVKGEIDLVLLNPNNEAEAVIEIKTAHGNPFLALFEDVIKFLSLVQEVRNKTVTLALGPLLGSLEVKFLSELRPIYALGCFIGPDDLQVATEKLLTIEMARLLASGMQEWENVLDLEYAPDNTTFRVNSTLTSLLQQEVAKYLSLLHDLDIYMVDMKL